jgi:hypothetical protein
MNVETAISVTLSLLSRVGLLDWNVMVVDDLNAFARSRRTVIDDGEILYGLTCYAEKFIVLGASVLDDDVKARNTISHEITHAYFGAGSDHYTDDFGVEWCSFRRLLDKICGVEPDMRPGCVLANN